MQLLSSLKKWREDVHECSTMLRLKWLHKRFRRGIIILDKEKRTVHKNRTQQRSLCRVKPVRAFLLPGGEMYAQKTIEALQVSRLPKPDGQPILPGAQKESRQGLQPFLP